MQEAESHTEAIASTSDPDANSTAPPAHSSDLAEKSEVIHRITPNGEVFMRRPSSSPSLGALDTPTPPLSSSSTSESHGALPKLLHHNRMSSMGDYKPQSVPTLPSNTTSSTSWDLWVPPFSKLTTSITAALSKASFFTPSKTAVPEPPMLAPSSRPDKLPPKSPEEEAKHMREYEEMMRNYRRRMEKEAKEFERREKLKMEREKKILYNMKLWEDILKQWSKKKDLQTTKDLWWEGIPPNIRCKLWPLAVPNDLNITDELFSIFSKHAEQLKYKRKRKNSRPKKSPLATTTITTAQDTANQNAEITSTETPHGSHAQNGADGGDTGGGLKSGSDEGLQEVGKESTASLIPLDLGRTFPALSFFQEGGPCHESLQKVLEAYVCYRPDIGYVQGMSYIGATLLLYLDATNAFICLCNILNKPPYLQLYRLDSEQVRVYVNCMVALMKEYLPSLWAHFDSISIHPDMFLIEWLLPLYSKLLPLDVVGRIWDVFFLEGEPFLFRTALGILKWLSPTLEKASFDVIMKKLNHIKEVDDVELFQSIHSINLPHKKFYDVFKQVS